MRKKYQWYTELGPSP